MTELGKKQVKGSRRKGIKGEGENRKKEEERERSKQKRKKRVRKEVGREEGTHSIPLLFLWSALWSLPQNT